jgi:hypothetical protein
MAKKSIRESKSKTIEGTLDLETMCLDCEDLGAVSLEDEFREYDGKLVTIKIETKS